METCLSFQKENERNEKRFIQPGLALHNQNTNIVLDESSSTRCIDE